MIINELSTNILPKNIDEHFSGKILLKFLSFIYSEKRYSINTVKAYACDIYSFIDFLSQKIKEDIDSKALQDARLVDFRGWLSFRLKNHDNISNARALSAVRSFFKFLEINYNINNNEIKKIKTPKISKPIAKSIDVVDIDKVLKYISTNHKEKWKNERDEALIFIIYGCGLRISEVLSITKNSIIQNGFNKDSLNILGKGGVERVIPILPIIIKKITQYLDNLPFSINNEQVIFLNDSGKTLNRRCVNQLLINIRRNSNLSESITPHAFRHSFATHLLESGADIRSIQQLLGHKNLATTERYTKVNKAKLLDSYSKFQIR